MTTSAPSDRLTGVVKITGRLAARAAAIIRTQASSTGRIAALRAGSDGVSARRQTSYAISAARRRSMRSASGIASSEGTERGLSVTVQLAKSIGAHFVEF